MTLKVLINNYNESIFLSTVLIISIALFNALRGISLLLVVYPNKSLVLLKMQELMPLPIYGIVFFASAMFLMLSVFLKGNKKAIFMMAGGLLGAVGLSLYASASSLEVDNLLVPFRYALLSLANLSIVIAGGFYLWQTRIRDM